MTNLFDLVKSRISAMIPNDNIKVSLGDEGTSEPYNTVTIDDVEFLQGQAWSGPPSDSEEPTEGPVSETVNLGPLALIVKGVLGVIGSRCCVENTGITGVSSATTMSGSATYLDDDLFSFSGGSITLLDEARTQGNYEVAVYVTASNSSADDRLEIQLQKNSVDVDGFEAFISLPGSLGIGKASGGFSKTLIDVQPDDSFRVRVIALTGPINVTSFSFEMRRV
jgi:hypothetical protein